MDTPVDDLQPCLQLGAEVVRSAEVPSGQKRRHQVAVRQTGNGMPHPGRSAAAGTEGGRQQTGTAKLRGITILLPYGIYNAMLFPGRRALRTQRKDPPRWCRTASVTGVKHGSTFRHRSSRPQSKFRLPQIRLEHVNRHLVARPQQAGSAGDTDLVNDEADIRRIHANEHHATPARSRTGGRR